MFEAKKNQDIRQAYDIFKANQQDDNAGKATAYGRTPVRYEVNISGGNTAAGTDDEEPFRREKRNADWPSDFDLLTPGQKNAKRIAESNQNIKRGTVDFAAEIAAAPFEIATFLGIKEASPIAKGIKKAVGYDDSKPVTSPSALTFSSIGLGIAKLTGDKEREAELSKQVEYQEKSAGERPGEFLSAALLDLAPVGGFKAAKARIGSAIRNGIEEVKIPKEVPSSAKLSQAQPRHQVTKH